LQLTAASADLEEAQKIVDTLYARWSELESGQCDDAFRI
jgi:hypothetical protein